MIELGLIVFRYTEIEMGFSYYSRNALHVLKSTQSAHGTILLVKHAFKIIADDYSFKEKTLILKHHIKQFQCELTPGFIT